MGLTARDRAILDFERTWWTTGGCKGDAIRAELGISAARYYQLRDALLDVGEASAYDPLVVGRLRRMRSQRRRGRYEGRPVSGRPIGQPVSAIPTGGRSIR